MKLLTALFALIIFATPAHAQCTVPGCEAATAVVSEARATARAIITAEAPPTFTPAPTATQQPTATPMPTQTPEPTATETARPTQTATMQPTATQQPMQTATPVSEPTTRMAGVPFELWCIIGIILMSAGIGLGMRMVSKWRK